MAQGRLESEVTFQQIPGAVSDTSCPTADYVVGKILLHEQMRRGKYLAQSFSLLQSFFFFSFLPLSALILRD